MLDYMAAALPIICTPQRTRGLDGREGEDYLILGREFFAENIQSLLKIPAFS